MSQANKALLEAAAASETHMTVLEIREPFTHDIHTGCEFMLSSLRYHTLDGRVILDLCSRTRDSRCATLKCFARNDIRAVGEINGLVTRTINSKL